jgi:hypothetical protein
MSTVLSALVVLGALTASGVLLVQLAVSESRRGRRRADRVRRQAERQTLPLRAVHPERHTLPVRTAPLPERTVPPRPAPVERPAPAQPAAWAPTLSADGAWLWTGSAWVPAWWGGPTVPPPPWYAVATPPPRARSHGCAAALGMGCAVALLVVAVVALAVAATAAGLFRPSGG